MDAVAPRFTTDAVAPLGPDLQERATITLAQAFSTDPMFAWLFPHPEARALALRRFFSVALEFGLRYGRVTQSHGGMATAVWLPPGQAVTVGRMVRAGMLSLPFRVGFRPVARFVGANETMERIHKRRVPEPHWYLLLLGVDPQLQGRGLGSALVQEGLAQADQANCPGYLETSEERNLAFYERHGFTVLETVTLGAGGPRGWAMRREPQGPR